MKKVLLGLSILIGMVSCGSKEEAVAVSDVASQEEVVEENTNTSVVYNVSVDASELKWSGKKLAYGHHGVISIQSGEVKVSEGAIESANIVVDMSTITETDNPDAENAAKLAGHLKNADFFNVDSFPTAKVVVTKVEEGKVFAELTIKGITKAIEIPAEIVVSDMELNVQSHFTINRTDWGIVYGSGSFMDLAKDKAIDDLITFDINVTAKK